MLGRGQKGEPGTVPFSFRGTGGGDEDGASGAFRVTPARVKPGNAKRREGNAFLAFAPKLWVWRGLQLRPLAGRPSVKRRSGRDLGEEGVGWGCGAGDPGQLAALGATLGDQGRVIRSFAKSALKPYTLWGSTL